MNSLRITSNETTNKRSFRLQSFSFSETPCDDKRSEAPVCVARALSAFPFRSHSRLRRGKYSLMNFFVVTQTDHKKTPQKSFVWENRVCVCLCHNHHYHLIEVRSQPWIIECHSHAHIWNAKYVGRRMNGGSYQFAHFMLGRRTTSEKEKKAIARIKINLCATAIQHSTPVCVSYHLRFAKKQNALCVWVIYGFIPVWLIFINTFFPVLYPSQHRSFAMALLCTIHTSTSAHTHTLQLKS